MKDSLAVVFITTLDDMSEVTYERNGLVDASELEKQAEHDYEHDLP